MGCPLIGRDRELTPIELEEDYQVEMQQSQQDSLTVRFMSIVLFSTPILIASFVIIFACNIGDRSHRRKEIFPQTYQEIENLINEHPQLLNTVKETLDDDQISIEEFYQITREARTIEESRNHKQNLKDKVEKLRPKENLIDLDN